MLTAMQARNLKQGQTLYHTTSRNVDGTPQRWRVTSVKTWKTKPDVLVNLKWGLKTYDSIRLGCGIHSYNELCLTEADALGKYRKAWMVVHWDDDYCPVNSKICQSKELLVEYLWDGGHTVRDVRVAVENGLLDIYEYNWELSKDTQNDWDGTGMCNPRKLEAMEISELLG